MPPKSSTNGMSLGVGLSAFLNNERQMKTCLKTVTFGDANYVLYL